MTAASSAQAVRCARVPSLRAVHGTERFYHAARGLGNDRSRPLAVGRVLRRVRTADAVSPVTAQQVGRVAAGVRRSLHDRVRHRHLLPVEAVASWSGAARFAYGSATAAGRRPSAARCVGTIDRRSIRNSNVPVGRQTDRTVAPCWRCVHAYNTNPVGAPHSGIAADACAIVSPLRRIRCRRNRSTLVLNWRRCTTQCVAPDDTGVASVSLT